MAGPHLPGQPGSGLHPSSLWAHALCPTPQINNVSELLADLQPKNISFLYRQRGTHYDFKKLSEHIMKNFLVLSISVIIWSVQSMACSEAGPHDFDVSPGMQNTCGKIALQYALQFAKTIVNIEKNETGYDGPLSGFTPEKALPGLYTTQKRTGNSKLIGFNVGLNSKNKWECNFCVDMAVDEKGNCKIETIRRHMCAK